jgi:hypothetical protein
MGGRTVRVIFFLTLFICVTVLAVFFMLELRSG